MEKNINSGKIKIVGKIQIVEEIVERNSFKNLKKKLEHIYSGKYNVKKHRH